MTEDISHEPPVDGESTKEARARRARNRKRAEFAQEEGQPEGQTKKKNPRGRPAGKNKREQAVLSLVTGVGIATMAFNEFDGQTIIEGAPDLAKSLANLAEKRPAVAKALDTLTETSAWAEVALASGAIIVPIVRNHAPKPKEKVEEEELHNAKDLPIQHQAEQAYEPSFAPAPFQVQQNSDVVDSVPTFRVVEDQ